MEVDALPECQDAGMDDIMQQMATASKVISSLKGLHDPLAMKLREKAEADLKRLRIERTQQKPLKEQIDILTDVVERKRQQVIDIESKI
eukprot:1553002-Karenia_brevis.AAC.1